MSDIKQGQILIIDDDKGVVHSMVKIIEKLKLDIDFSFNLEDGLKKNIQ